MPLRKWEEEQALLRGLGSKVDGEKNVARDGREAGRGASEPRPE